MVSGLLVVVAIGWVVALGTGAFAPTPAAGIVPLQTEPSRAASSAESPAPTSARSLTPTPSPSVGTGVVATRVIIPRLGINLPIYQGDGYTAKIGMAAHYPTTGWPGSGSLTYLYSHARDGNFLALWKARPGDVVELSLVDGSLAHYKVSRIVPDVRWNDLSWLQPTHAELLRLQTCNGSAETDPRFIVEAVRIDRLG